MGNGGERSKIEIFMEKRSSCIILNGKKQQKKKKKLYSAI